MRCPRLTSHQPPRPSAPHTKKRPRPGKPVGVFLYVKAWQCPTFTWGNPILSSALSVFTSEFGKGSGGSHSLWPPGKPLRTTKLDEGRRMLRGEP